MTPLRKRRRSLDLSQSEVAQRLGFRSHSHYSRIEKGERLPEPETVERLARLFEVTPATINSWTRKGREQWNNSL